MPNTIARTLCAAATIGLLALTGCEQIDPLTRPYMWKPDEAVAHNMAVMAANPADLEHGRESRVRRSSIEADGADRLWSGKQFLLIPTGGSFAGATAGGTGATAAGGGI